MAFIFRKSSKAKFVTSVTTTIAFLSTSFSNILPISTFGVYATLLIPVNYIFVIIIVPS